MNIRILLFATLKDLAGKNRFTLTIPLETANVLDVRQALRTEYPSAKANIDAAIAAVNEEYAFPSDAVHDGDEVAFFPPVSGGSTDYPEVFKLASEPIDTDALVQAITIPATGAVCIFSGMVRGETSENGTVNKTQNLEYEAYEPMAIKMMNGIAEELRTKWQVKKISMVHRIGRVEIGEASVVIAVSATHRKEAFEACRYAIDTLKKQVPIWKKEYYVDGEVWVGSQES